MNNISTTQQALKALVQAGDTSSTRYKRLRAKVQKCADAKSYADGPSLSPWKVNHIFGHAANRRKTKK